MCAAPPPPGEKLSAAQLEEVLGKTAIGRNDRGEDFAFYSNPDGTFKLKMERVSDVGTYHITEDGEFCAKYTEAFGAKEYCYRIYRDGETYRSVRVGDGSVESTYTLTPGNPRNL
jgi:hypothetical protein